MLLFTCVLLALFSVVQAQTPVANIAFSYVPNVHIVNTRLVNSITVTVDGSPVVDPQRAFALLTLICNGQVMYSAPVALNQYFSIPTVSSMSVCRLSATYDDNTIPVSTSTEFPFNLIPYTISGKYFLDGSDLMTTLAFNYR